MRTFAARPRAGHGPMVLTRPGGALVRPGTPAPRRHGPFGPGASGGLVRARIRADRHYRSRAPRDRRTVLRDPRPPRGWCRRDAGRHPPPRDRIAGRARLVRRDHRVPAPERPADGVHRRPCSPRWAACTSRKSPTSIRAGCAGTSGSRCIRSWSSWGSRPSDAIPASGSMGWPWPRSAAAISAYHVALEWIPALDTGACGLGPSCSVVWFRVFGFISLPTLALIAFVSILALLAVVSPESDDDADADADEPRPSRRRTESSMTKPTRAQRRAARREPAPTSSASRWLLPVAAVVLLGVGGLAWFLGQGGSGATPSPAPSAASSAVSTPGHPSSPGRRCPRSPARPTTRPWGWPHRSSRATITRALRSRSSRRVGSRWSSSPPIGVPIASARSRSSRTWVDGGGLPDDVDIVTVSTGIEPTAPNYPPEAWFEREGWTAPIIVDETGSVATGVRPRELSVLRDPRWRGQRDRPVRRRDPDGRAGADPRVGAARLRLVPVP